MEYNRPDPISFEIPYESNEVELTLDFRLSYFSLTPRSEFSIKQRLYISLSSNKSLSFDDFRNLIWRINKFLCLAIDEPVSFDSVTAFSKEKLESIEDEKQETPMKLYFIGNSHPEIKTEILWGVTCLFFYRINEIKEFVNDLSCWMQNYEKYNIPINLYFASVHGGGHIEQKFLSLAQGIEVLHGQSTNSIDKKICLSYRIKEVAEKFKDDLFVDDTEQETFAQNVKNERHWLSHYGWAKSPFMKEYDLEGFLELNKKLEVLFQCHLMELAGRKLERIKEIVKKPF